MLLVLPTVLSAIVLQITAQLVPVVFMLVHLSAPHAPQIVWNAMLQISAMTAEQELT